VKEDHRIDPSSSSPKIDELSERRGAAPQPTSVLRFETWIQRYSGLIARSCGWSRATEQVLQCLISRLGGKDVTWAGQQALASSTGLRLRSIEDAFRAMRRTYWGGLPMLEVSKRGRRLWNKRFPGLTALWRSHAGGSDEAIAELLRAANSAIDRQSSPTFLDTDTRSPGGGDTRSPGGGQSPDPQGGVKSIKGKEAKDLKWGGGERMW
jgi:hypothetical protein